MTLSPDESEIIRLFRAGQSDASIARALGWSRSRVQERKALLRRAGAIPPRKPAKVAPPPKPKVDPDADFLAALRASERPPANARVREGRAVAPRVSAPVGVSCFGSPAAQCVES